MYVQYQEIKTRFSPLLFALTILCILGLIALIELKKNDIKSWLSLAGLFIIVIGTYFIKKKKIIITNESIKQELFFGKSIEILWTEITQCNFEFRAHGHGGYFILEIKTNNKKLMQIYTSSYSKKDKQFIAETIASKATHNTPIDKKILQMAQGKFPWYVL